MVDIRVCVEKTKGTDAIVARPAVRNREQIGRRRKGHGCEMLEVL